MDYQAHFQMNTTDLFGCISPGQVFQEVNDCVGYELHMLRLVDALGATWMMGQMVMEYFAPIMPGVDIRIEVLPREHHGVGTLYRSRLWDGDLERARVALKVLPVYVGSRKVVPPSAMAPLWATPDVPAGAPVNWVRLPERMTLAERIPVRQYMCDVNGHMTAFQYLNYICEAAGYWDGALHLIRRMQVDFKAEFLPGETLELYRGGENGVTFISGRHTDGRLGFNASVQLEREATPSYRETMRELGNQQ